MGAIKLTSQSRLQTRKRGAREAGTALVTLVTILVQLSPRAVVRRVPSPVRDADISLCRQPYLCPASGTSPCLAVLTSPWAQGEHKGDRKHWRPGSPRGNASAQRTRALADALMGRTQRSWCSAPGKALVASPRCSVPLQAAGPLQGKCWVPVCKRCCCAPVCAVCTAGCWGFLWVSFAASPALGCLPLSWDPSN